MSKNPRSAEKTAGIQRGKPFRKGQSGNPAGKPKGARHRVTIAAEALLAGEAKAITRKCVDLAKDGDSAAMRLCIERLIPTARERRIALKLPKVNSAADVTAALGEVLDAVATGQIAPGEGQSVAALIDHVRRGIETNHLEARIAELERRQMASALKKRVDRLESATLPMEEFETKLHATAGKIGVSFERLAAVARDNHAEDWLNKELSSGGGMTWPTFCALNDMLDGKTVSQ